MLELPAVLVISPVSVPVCAAAMWPPESNCKRPLLAFSLSASVVSRFDEVAAAVIAPELVASTIPATPGGRSPHLPAAAAGREGGKILLR